MRFAIAALMVAACERATPSCGALEQRLRALVAADQRRWDTRDAGAAAPFLPVLGPGGVDDLVARCRAGTLPAPFTRCATAARTSDALDRCAARHDRAE